MTPDNVTEVQTHGSSVKFLTTSELLLKRAENIHTLEPETIAWINLMNNGENFWDIGANVGTYSIYASVEKGLNVTAFEPEASNFNLLNKNIRLNNCQKKMLAYPLAIGNAPMLSTLFLSDARDGWACHSVGQDLSPFLEQRDGKFPQGTICLGLDTILENIGTPPDHIKIDVDGLEHQVIASATKLLQNKRVKSLLVELTLSLPEHQDVISKLSSTGFHVHQQLIEKTTLKEGFFKGMCNVIFARDEQLLENIYERISSSDK